MPFRSWCTVCQRAKGQHQHHKGNQKLTSVIQLDHSFYKVPGERQSLKVLTFVETITSMSGAVIVPDLSANQVAVKALKKLIAVNGFTKSVLQYDGHSGLLALQEQVGQEMSLPIQVSPPYSHQSQGTVERFRKTLYGQVRAIRIGLADHLKVDADHLDAAFMPWIIQHATFQINRFLVRSDGKTSFEKVFKKPQRSPIVHFGERVLAHIQSQPPPQKLQIRASPQKSFGLWLGKDVITGMHIVTLMDGQILKTRTVTRLTRQDQFKLEEFKKFRIALHESSVVHKEDSHDQMLFKDLVRKFLLQQRNQVTFESSERDSRVTHSPDPLQDSSTQGASSVPSAEGASSSDHHGIPHPPGLPQPIRRTITGKQPPSEFEINMINSLKQGILEINEFSVNSDQGEEDQELQLLQDLKLQEWYQGDLQGYSEKEVKEAIKKELISLSSAGHEVYDPVPLNLLSSEEQAKIIESRWVIGPRSGQLKARFVGKGYTQIIDKESKDAHTPQATTLKIILLMSQIHKWSLCVSDVASASLNTPIDGSKGFIHVQAPQRFNTQSRPFGGSNVSYMVSEIHRDHGRFI